ncbi:aldose 1-epimerase [Tenacibaculum sp. UWU-22]|uniref:aldose 1-epimerase n=1 Tax=Tenacibaculum sp. UWU-22 TaxID=3234187 RepID=UPI0034DB3722
MYTIKNTEKREEHYIEIQNFNDGVYAKIDLIRGASLQALKIDNKKVIKEFTPDSPEKTYASSILFPFAGRVNNGKYEFNEVKYQLPINEEGNNNALHGFLYNKPFSLVDEYKSKTTAIVKLAYQQTEKIDGFPYKYSVNLSYTFTKNTVSLDIAIENDDTNPFPFTIGWHPFFYSSNLGKSYLKLESSKKVIFDETLIPIEEKDTDPLFGFEINNKKLDDCFLLNNNEVNFTTPEYNISIKSSSNKRYLQVYTPEHEKDTVAIEPVTAPSNSFNNKLGLQYLDPNKTYEISWKIEFENTNNTPNIN